MAVAQRRVLSQHTKYALESGGGWIFRAELPRHDRLLWNISYQSWCPFSWSYGLAAIMPTGVSAIFHINYIRLVLTPIRSTSYAECIDVLYATNTMYMTGNPLFQQLQEVRRGPGTIHMAGDVLPRLLSNVLLPKRLASITSARIRWTSHPFGYESETSPFYKRLDLSNFLKDLPRIFPHLKKLRLSLEGKMKPIPYVGHDPLLELIESVIFTPVDDMVRSLGPQMEKCHLAIAGYLFVAMSHKPTNPTRNLSSQERHGWLRPWRELPASGSTATHVRGYGIRIGQLDIPIKSIIPEGYDDF